MHRKIVVSEQRVDLYRILLGGVAACSIPPQKAGVEGGRAHVGLLV